MKTKLTLSIDKNLIPKSKAYARKFGKSVSQLVEDLLKDKINQGETNFSSKWRGKFELDPRDESRFKKLSDRYLS
jgi:hypothetical protein